MSHVLQKPIKAIQAHGIIGPAAILFVSANIANTANLVFNMIFARLMSPALFADLTLLLTLKLGALSFLSALQFAFAEMSAKENNIGLSKTKAYTLSWSSLKVSVPIMFILIASAGLISTWLNFSSPWAFSVLALAVPFFLPMVIYRGLTQGLIQIPKIVLSIQSEWIVRLIGSILLWKLGFGLVGIAVAVGLSILAGFIFSTSKEDWTACHAHSKGQSNAKTLGLIAMPYLILQFAQILVLDSDILIAKITFSPETSGLVAGLLLIQRVFFFAFLSASMILQPIVAKQRGQDGTSKELFVLLFAIALISATALLAIIPNSDLVVRLLLGSAYGELASTIWISALTGAVFIISHLCAIYTIAKGQKRAAQIVLGFGIAQLFILSVVNHIFAEISLDGYFMIKLGIQVICAVCLIGFILLPHRNPKPYQ